MDDCLKEKDKSYKMQVHTTMVVDTYRLSTDLGLATCPYIQTFIYLLLLFFLFDELWVLFHICRVYAMYTSEFYK
jgi:hypothetical protein